ncbi:MAG: tetratricopeptide repeat protein [Promethearchaeota archaeon]
MEEKEFKINDYITLKLEKKHTVIYVAGKKFDQCKYLAFQIELQNVQNYDNIQSIDEMEQLDRSNKFKHLNISPEEEFWGHCSNIHAWIENDYDTRLLHSNLAFPLLKKLTEVGNSKATKVFKNEIGMRLKSNYPPVVHFLCKEGYIGYLTIEEIFSLGDEPFILNLGNILLSSHKLDKAIKCFEKILSIEPHSRDTWNILAMAYLRYNKVDKAVECLKRALKIFPNDITILNNLVSSFYKQNNSIKVIKYTHKLILLEPGNIMLLKRLSGAYLKINEIDNAILHAKKVVNLKPEDGRGWLQLGYCYEKKGDIKKANEFFKKAEELNPTPSITLESIFNVLDKNEWQNIKDLIVKLKIKDMLHAELLQLKLLRLAKEHQILMEIINKRKKWKLK